MRSLLPSSLRPSFGAAVIVAFMILFVAPLTPLSTFVSTPVWADDDEEGGASISSLKKQLKDKLRSGSTSHAQLIVDQLAALQTADAVDALVEVGLRADNYEIERHIGGRLSEMPAKAALERICFQANRHKDHRVRIILTLVLSRRPEPEAFEARMKNLKDRFSGVVLAVLETLQGKKEKNKEPEYNFNSVEYLIDALKNQEKAIGGGDGLIRFELRSALTNLTGYDFPTAEDWNKFWNPYRKKPETFERRDTKKAESGTGVVLKRPTFFDIEIPDDKVLFILDISGSMEKKDAAPEETGDGDGKDRGPLTGVRKKKKKKKEKIPQDQIPDSRRRLSRVQAELVRVLQDLPPKVKFDILTFNQNVDSYKGELVNATPKNKQLAIRYVQGFKAEGQTHTDEALEQAFDLQGITSIYLLSDGAPRRDDVLLPVDPILQRVRELNRFRRIHIHTVGFLQAGKNLRRFMQKLAWQNRGEYRELR